MTDVKEKSAKSSDKHHSEVAAADFRQSPKGSSLPMLERDSQVRGDTVEKTRTRRPLYARVIPIILAVIVVGGGGYAGYKIYQRHEVPASTRAERATDSSNEALQKNNKAQALADAKKALAAEPNNVNDILAVAYLTKAEDPSAAKQYFVQAFNEFKQQNNPDVSGKSAETYWAAAGLAEQAGEINQAKHYYQEVIQAAKPSDSYAESLANQSRIALVRLQ